MKLSVAAAAIAFSGTAFILTPTAATAAQQDSKPHATAKADWSDTGAAKGESWSGKAASTAGKAEGMGGPLEEVSTKGGMGEELAGADVDGKFDTADLDTSAKFASAGTGMGGKLASADKGGETGAKLASADMDMGAKLAGSDAGSGISGKTFSGMGGPEEETGSTKQASDRNSSEPVDAAAATKDSTAPGAERGQGKEAHTEAHSGMGGPEEATTEYPPCSPGPGDDRCIQLYERDVGGGSAKGSTRK